MKDIYLVTGANGHLGNNIVRKLISKNKRVFPMILPGDDSPALKDLPVEPIEADILSYQDLNRAFSYILEKEKPSNVWVIHCAGIVFISSAYQKKVEEVNVGGTLNILKACNEFDIKRLVYISTVHAIPEKIKGEIIRETTCFDPKEVVGFYAKTKSLATKAVLDAVAEGLDCVIVHPSGIIGPGDFNQGHQTQLFIDYLKGRLFAVVKGGYDFVDVRDVAKGVISALEIGRKGECYILSNRYVEITELIDVLHRVSGKKPVRFVMPMAIAKLTAPLSEIYYKVLGQRPLYTKYSLYTLESNSIFSHEKATKELGYSPRPLEDTVTDTFNWLMEKGML